MKSIIRLLCATAITGSILFSCNSDGSKKEAGLITIDLEAMVNQPKETALADLARNVRYIPLETTKEAMLSPTKVIYVNDNIYVLNRDQKVFLFNGEGKFVRQIGVIGKGPEEYSGAQGMEVSPDGSLIYLYYTRESVIYTYNREGKKINSIPITYPSWRYAPLRGGGQIMISPYGSFSPDSANFLFYVQDESGKLRKRYPSTQVIRMTGDFSIGAFFVDPVRTLAYQPFCDTVFELGPEGELAPVFYLNFGKHKAPDELYADMNNTMDPKEHYYLRPELIQTKDELFISIREMRKKHIGIYNFKDGNIYSIDSGDGLIPNNYDGGPGFWPSGTDGNKLVYRVIEPINLLEDDHEKLDGKTVAGNKNAAAVYQDLLTKINENDNPILMVVELL